MSSQGGSQNGEDAEQVSVQSDQPEAKLVERSQITGGLSRIARTAGKYLTASAWKFYRLIDL